jgi:hypothetical protein
MTATDEARDKLTAALAALAALPDSPDAIAAFLVERGIKSAPRANCFDYWCNFCPLAVYLEQAISTSVVVTACTVEVWGMRIDIALPIAVSAFIGRMDRDEYPELVKSS